MTNEPKDWAKFKAEYDKEQTSDTSPENKAEAEEVNEDVQKVDSDRRLEHPDYDELENKLFESEQTAQKNWDAAVRAKAELENVRRQAERDVERAHKYGASRLVESLLPVVDSLEQALNLAEQTKDQAMQEGLDLTMKIFLDTLEKQGITQIDPMGEPFNPEQHEAMSMQPSDEVAPNTVVAVFQKGYDLNGRIVRPARVVVAKK